MNNIFPTETNLNDLAEDKFGFKNLSEKIVQNILIPMKTPNCFGLYGNWGSGKTTLLNFIMKQIEQKQEIISVYFEPWKYEYSDEKDLLYALLNQIKLKLNINKNEWKTVLTDALTIGSGVLKNLHIVNVQESKEDLKTFENMIFKEHEQWFDKIEKFKNDFDVIIKQGLKTQKATKLFIFIDDLDRCLPENTVKLLEGLKNFLTTDNTLFILAIDKRIVSEMIEKKYGLHSGYGEEYLIKIIHYYYELPKNDQKILIEEIFKSHDIEFAPTQIDYINKFLINFAGEPRITKHLLQQFCMNMKLSSKMKNTINEDKDGIQIEFFFVAIYLLFKYPKLFSYGDDTEILNNIRDSRRAIKNNERPEVYAAICAQYQINPNERKEIEKILGHIIKKANHDELDTAQIINALNIIKKI